MPEIGISEPRPRREVMARLLGRATVSAVVIVDGVVRLFDGASTAAVASAIQVPWEPTHTLMLALAELLFGVCLMIGLFTRTAAFVISLGAATGMGVALVTTPASFPVVALLALLAAGALSLVAEGGGEISADHGLAERARRKAIQEDPLWNRPPYVY